MWAFIRLTTLFPQLPNNDGSKVTQRVHELLRSEAPKACYVHDYIIAWNLKTEHDDEPCGIEDLLITREM